MKLFLDKGEQVKIEGRIDSTVFNCTLAGTRLNEDHSRHYQELRPFWIEGLRLQDAMAGKSRAEQEALYERFRQVMARRRACEMDYIDANPDNPLAGYCLTKIPIDSVLTYHERLADAARNSIFRPLLEPLLAKAGKYRLIRLAEAKIVAGSPAPDFTLKTADDKNFTLSSLRGKYVVLDFWGSWCGWCIKGIPEMKRYYDRYKSKLEIVGVDCNDTPERWLAAVEEHRLPWINVYNPKDVPAAEDISVEYAVSGYPTKVIIGPDGLIIGKYAGEGPDFYEALHKTIQ